MTEGPFKEHHLSADEIELLAQLAEEASEVAQAAMKIVRHGWDSYNPDLPVQEQVSNAQHLMQEIHELNVVVRLVGETLPMRNTGPLHIAPLHVLERKRKYQHYQG